MEGRDDPYCWYRFSGVIEVPQHSTILSKLELLLGHRDRRLLPGELGCPTSKISQTPNKFLIPWSGFHFSH